MSGYRLVDAAADWLPRYGPNGPMQAVGELRSPRELDFSLGCPERGMAGFVDEDGSRPLKNVYSLADAACETCNLSTTREHRVPGWPSGVTLLASRAGAGPTRTS